MFAAAMLCAAFAQLPPLTDKTADEYLAQLHAEQPDYFERLETIAKSCVGVPYAENPLGEGPGAPFDSDSLIDLNRVDGFSFVYQCLALAGSRTLAETTEALNQIRYINGEVDFARRNIFFVEEWVVNNTFVTNITPELGVPMRGLLRFVNKMEYLSGGGRGPVGGKFAGEGAPAPKRELTEVEKLFQDVRPEAITINYIWRQDISKAAPKLPDNCLVALIGKASVYFGENCALHFRDGEEPGNVYYASPEQGRVVAETLEQAFSKSAEYIGILVYSLHPERMTFVEQPESEPAQAEKESRAPDEASETAVPE